MESIPVDQIFEYNSDTLQFLRKQYELDKPERLEEAVTILLEWLKKQQHIVKKDYSKGYLERTIIISKGSVERAKMKLDKIATFRTLLPRYFEPIADVGKMIILDEIIMGFLPKMTKDHYRVFIVKPTCQQYESGFMNFYRYIVMICEYIQAHDYCNGVLAIYDYRLTSVYEIVKAINVVEMQQTLAIIMEGFGMRLKGIHFITSSKAIDLLVTLFKKFMSAKIGERIHVHKTVDSLYKYVPNEIMPSDYGGQAKTISELSSDLKAALGSEHFLKYLEDMQNACTNENYRCDNKFNDQCLGMPGSFRKLNVD